MKYIVSDEHRFIYFIVQKVACTSIKTALAPVFSIDVEQAEANRDATSGGPRFVVHRLFRDSGYQIDEKQLLAGLDGEYSGYFKFGFVRNPWDRIVSCYADKITGVGVGLGRKTRAGMELTKGMPFDRFVEIVHATPDSEANNHFKSQHNVFCPRGDGEILADFVGRFENLAADFAHVMSKTGLEGEIELPHKLRSGSREGRPYAEYYDARLKELVRERFRDDIDIFGYSF